MNIRPRVGMATLFSLVVIGLFALGSWIVQQREPEPLQWQERYQTSIWTPLREGELKLADVDAPLGIGRLWMVSVEDEPLLVSRYMLESDDLSWRVQAVIGLDAQRTESLVQAQDWQAGMRDQSVSPSVGAALAGQPVERISLIPLRTGQCRANHGHLRTARRADGCKRRQSGLGVWPDGCGRGGQR